MFFHSNTLSQILSKRQFLFYGRFENLNLCFLYSVVNKICAYKSLHSVFIYLYAITQLVWSWSLHSHE